MQPVYKILTLDEWSEFQQTSTFLGNNHDKRDGFIHLVSHQFLQRILEKYFIELESVIILEFSEESFGDNLHWEKAGDNNLYPHLYSTSLRLDDILKVEKRELK